MKRTRSGFTMVELLVSMAILVLLSIALIIITRAGLAEYETTSGRAALQMQARLLMDKMIPVLATAVRLDGDDASDPLLLPAVKLVPTDPNSTRIIFRSSWDLLAHQQVATVNSNDPIQFRDFVQKYYDIVWNPVEVGGTDREFSVFLREVNPDFVTPANSAPVSNDPADWQQLAQHIYLLEFERLQESAVTVRITASNFVGGRFHTGDMMRRVDRAAVRGDVTAGGNDMHRDTGIYTLESALQLPVYTGI